MNIIDTVDLHLKNRDLTLFNCIEGKIEYYNNEIKNDDEIAIYSIFLDKNYQRKGILTNLINHIINHREINRIIVIQPNFYTCVILQTKLFSGRYFHNHLTGELIWIREPLTKVSKSQYYDHCKSEEIAKLLGPAKEVMKCSSIEEFTNYIQNNDLLEYM